MYNKDHQHFEDRNSRSMKFSPNENISFTVPADGLPAHANQNRGNEVYHFTGEGDADATGIQELRHHSLTDASKKETESETLFPNCCSAKVFKKYKSLLRQRKPKLCQSACSFPVSSTAKRKVKSLQQQKNDHISYYPYEEESDVEIIHSESFYHPRYLWPMYYMVCCCTFAIMLLVVLRESPLEEYWKEWWKDNDLKKLFSKLTTEWTFRCNADTD